MINIGDKLFSTILKNEYLLKLYTKLITIYSNNVLVQSPLIELSEIEKYDLLKFADILSKSTEDSRRAEHNNFAQSIVSMLNSVFPEDEMIKYYMGSVLSNVNNYYGLSKNLKDYINLDFVENLKESIIKETYSIPNCDSMYFINAQKSAYKRMKENDYYSFSAPTSMGKTFLIRTLIKEIILKDEKVNFAIVVPSKALISEIATSIINDLQDDLAERNYKVIRNPSSIHENYDCNYIMVYTQERLLHHLIKNKNIIISYVFIDESHKISSKDDRNALFYKILEILQEQSYRVKIYFSCPNIPNPQIYLDLLKNNSNLAYNRFMYSPVNQHKIILDCDSNNISVYNELNKTFSNLDNLKVYDIIDSSENGIDLIYKIGNDKTNIIFCNSKKDAVDWAIEYSEKFSESPCSEIDELIKEIEEGIHEDCYLVHTLKKRVAYHVAYIPTNIKEAIEKLFKEGIIKTVFCTSTLLEGVNFPADNLFIMLNDKSEWLKEKNRANFKNLMGRVGRIEYNLFGNILFISGNEVIDKYKIAIKEEIAPQKLSIQMLTKDRKKDIINTLLNGNTILYKRKTDTYDSFNFARKILSTLLKDIINDKLDSHVIEYFSDLLDESKTVLIKNLFNEKNEKITDDLIVTCDQVESVDNSINLENLEYPLEVNYKNIYSFMLNLYKIYNWEQYESKNDIGKESRLTYFSTLMNKWMNGFGIKQIITEAIDYARDRKEFYIKNVGKVTYEDNYEHKNVIINQVLDELDEVLQYKICNYLLKFSERLMIQKETSYLNNDWYEFMEFGTKNRIVILLQKMGFSRDAANYINNQKYYVHKENEIYILASKINVKKFKKEIAEIKYNYPKNII